MAEVNVEEARSPSFCCLCRCALKGTKEGRRHKKLRRKFCTAERTSWERFAMEFDCFDKVQQAFSIDNAILCYSCIGKANKFDKLHHQLSQLKEEMADLLGQSWQCNVEYVLPGSSMLTSTPQRMKRSKGPAHSSKRTRVSVNRLCFAKILHFISRGLLFCRSLLTTINIRKFMI